MTIIVSQLVTNVLTNKQVVGDLGEEKYDGQGLGEYYKDKKPTTGHERPKLMATHTLVNISLTLMHQWALLIQLLWS